VKVRGRKKTKVAAFKLRVPLQPVSLCRAVSNSFFRVFSGGAEGAVALSCVEGGTDLLATQ